MNLKQFVRINLPRCEETLVKVHSFGEEFYKRSSSQEGYNGFSKEEINEVSQHIFKLSKPLINAMAWLKHQEAHLDDHISFNQANAVGDFDSAELEATFPKDLVSRLEPHHEKTISEAKEFAQTLIKFTQSPDNKKASRTRSFLRPKP